MPEALNAVIYARYSSDRQTEQSIEGQLRECYAFAKANDIAVIDTYIDRAISGKTDNRPAFQKMIEDSAKRQFQAVIVYRLDRFTRNRYDSAIYKARLKKNGVKVLSAMENLNGSPESIIMESLLEGMAEYYSVELSQKITRGMRENALKGKALGGQRVLGYKVNSDCYFEIDETTAPVVVDIFKLYSSGKTVKEICDILNARGVKTARGGAFNKNSLHTILTNKKYIFSTYYFQAIMKPKAAFVVSVARGLVISGILIMVLPALVNADAIWFAMPVTELLVMLYAASMIRKYTRALPGGTTYADTRH